MQPGTHLSDERSKDERKDGSSSGDFGVSGAEELARLRSDVDVARAGTETDPSLKQAARLADKRLELFLNEHDNVGAFKFKRFGREMRDLFREDGKEGRKRIALDEDGKLIVSEADRRRRMLFVNMGELDRFNKEGGGHAAGDAALAETAMITENEVRAALSSAGKTDEGYRMYRFSGNEFAVRIDDLPQEDLEKLLDRLAKAESKAMGVKEAAPLTAVSFDLGEVIDIYNDLQAELGPDERIDRPDDAARETIDVLKARAYYDLDIHKFESRVDRVRKKIGEEGAEKASVFFETYLKKMFKDTPLEEISAFESVSDEQVTAMAFEHARKNIQRESSFQSKRRDIVAARAARRRERAASSPSGETNGLAGVATIPERTRGQRVVDAFAQAKRDAEARGDTEAAELADLDHQIELARRDAGTGLLERGVHHTDLERGFREGSSQQLVFVDMGFLKYFDNKGGADVGDNALLKAADLMEQAVEDAGVTGTVYRYGGDEFTIRIDGDVDAAAKFIRTLEGLRATAGAIPMGRKGDSDGYVPTELVFNYGSADSQLAEDIFADMIAAGMFTEKELGDRDLIANAKADIITIAADKGIEEQKAVGRFEMLIERLRDSTCRTDPRCAMQTEQMIAFSQKALFGDRGGDALLRVWAESGKSLEDLHAEIEEWAVQQQERATSEKGRSRDLMTELIDAHAKIRYYERKLRETEQENEGLARENVELRTKVERLKEEKARAEEDRRRVIETRKGLE